MKEILYYLTTTDDPDYLFCPYTEQELANISGAISVSEVDEEEFMEYIRSFGHTYGVKPEFCTKENNYTEKITVAMLNQTEIEKLSRNIMQRIVPSLIDVYSLVCRGGLAFKIAHKI